jgi:transglutaminase-like putative cysteine protease
MEIRLGCDLQLDCEVQTVMLALVHPHASRLADLRGPEAVNLSPDRLSEVLVDDDGNRWSRFHAAAGRTSFRYEARFADSGQADRQQPNAPECAVGVLPIAAYRHLNPSTYCDTERLAPLAWSTFGDGPTGWYRVQAICDWIHARIRYDYGATAPDRTASQTLDLGGGVCRDFTHLGISLCRCLNIPARYCTGYLLADPDHPEQEPVDFAAWFEAYLGDRWYAFDPRHNVPRRGRVLIGRGRDAADVPFLRSFGSHQLSGFQVISEWSQPAG